MPRPSVFILIPFLALAPSVACDANPTSEGPDDAPAAVGGKADGIGYQRGDTVRIAGDCLRIFKQTHSFVLDAFANGDRDN